MNNDKNKFLKWLNIAAVLWLSLLWGCGTDKTPAVDQSNSTSLTITDVSCPSVTLGQVCRDVGRIIVEYQLEIVDNNTPELTAEIRSNTLDLVITMQNNGQRFESDLISLAGADDVEITLSATGSANNLVTARHIVGSIARNNAPTCDGVLLTQDFVVGENGGSVALIDLSRCSDLDEDDISLSNHRLNTNIIGDYSQLVVVEDSFGSAQSYPVTGTINLSAEEFSNQLQATPNAVGADNCFPPINQAFDEVIVCDFNNIWMGFQYGSNIDSSSFTNQALTNTAQGFINFTPNISLDAITANFSMIDLPDNQAIATLGGLGPTITANITQAPNGGFSDFSLSADGFILEGGSPIDSEVSCENGTFILPVKQTTGVRQSMLTIDQNFVETIGQSTTITNCLALNSAGLQTNLAGSISVNYTFAQNLTAQEFSSQLQADPSSVGADSCFDPINLAFDEVVVCDFNNEWIGFQYGSNVDTSGFDNTALAQTAQGFVNLIPNISLVSIVSGFVKTDLPDNYVPLVMLIGPSDVVINASIQQDFNGNFSNFILSPDGFILEGDATENSVISCENGSVTLPVNQSTGVRESTHTINQLFVEQLGQTTVIAGCVVTNTNGLSTTAEGSIEVTYINVANQAPQINSLTGIVEGFEGVRTISANVTDFDDNIASVVFRFRNQSSTEVWNETTLINIVGTDDFSANVTFSYNSNVDNAGLSEYQVIAIDSEGAQDQSVLSSVLSYANESTAQSTIESELNADINKSILCVDCTLLTGTLGPFDAVYDIVQSRFIYEYNGEQRSAADMQLLEDSLAGTGISFLEIPLGSVNSIITFIQNN